MDMLRYRRFAGAKAGTGGMFPFSVVSGRFAVHLGKPRLNNSA
jgi:hypothetical protein